MWDVIKTGKKQYKPKHDQFEVSPCGSIVDKKTGLEWFVGEDRNTNWHQAGSWAKKLGVCGGNWRMPTVEELKTVVMKDMQSGPGVEVKEQKYYFLLDPAFLGLGNGWWVWSSDKAEEEKVFAVGFIFGLEYAYRPDLLTNFRALAVRRHP